MQALSKPKLYWLAQLIGWSSYLGLAYIFNQLRGGASSTELHISLLSAFFIGLVVSHLYRTYLIKNRWLNRTLWPLTLRFVFGALAASLTFELLYYALTRWVFVLRQSFQLGQVFQEWLSWYVVFIIWSLLYFLFHFFRNYKNEEIKNLKWQATSKEMELNSLKSQLNPHFLFNALNTIRALVDEDPKKAKKAIGQMSHILRSSMAMHKQQKISFEEELKLVKDYLEIEQVRYESRLTVSYDIAPESKQYNVPPMMLQTLVENAIKHGISKTQEGGTVKLSTRIVNDALHISIANTGTYNPQEKRDKNSTGFGLKSTKERLHHLFGEEASFTIKNEENQMVRTTLVIPKKSIHV